MKNVYIKANREAYRPEQCGNTVTVRKLIEILRGYNMDSPVYISNDGGYTYGSIGYCDIYEREAPAPEEEEEEEETE